MMSEDNNEPDELELEVAILKSELLSREFIFGVLLQRLGGKTLITKEEMKDFQLLVGEPEDVAEKNNGYVAKRTRLTDGIEFAIIPKELKGKGN